MHKHFIQFLAVVAVTLAFSLPSGAQVPDYDFQWATITDVNNPVYAGGPLGQLADRGSVPYDYRISRLELTSAQFLEFVNTFWESEGIIMPAWFIGSSGIVPSLQGPYVLKNYLPNAGMVPVIGLNWRVSAMYCNWLHNGKQSTLESLQDGAYDASTFHTNPDGTFTDQITRSPGAKFWIPSLDEWIKAVHYDPNRYGQGQGGWWESPNGTDVPLVNGPPGIGQTSGAGDYNWGFDPSYIPLSSYTDVQSPWGLWDASGGAQEWTEEIIWAETGPYGRMIDGSWAGAEWRFAYFDRAWGTDWAMPQFDVYNGLRIASSVPGPGSGIVLAIVTALQMRRRRRSC